jgi:hypothetical protein
MDPLLVLQDGKYSVWFRTALAEGMGVVTLAPDGSLNGRDTIMSYTGRWQTDSERFEATFLATRHSSGPGAFGDMNELNITLTGKAKGVTASCKGAAEEVPGLILEATLVRMPKD